MVKAMIEYFKEGSAPIINRYELVFDGETSGWSETQTITFIRESQTPPPNQETQQANLTTTIVGATIVAVVLGAGLGLLIYLIKRK